MPRWPLPNLHGFGFTLAVVVAVAASMTWPSHFSRWGGFETKALIVPLIQVIMFGMGTTLSVGDFTRVLAMPWPVLVGILEDGRGRGSGARDRIHHGTWVAIAQANATNDVNLRCARKSLEVAKAELQRAELSNENFAKSVSDSEMDRLGLLVQRSTLEVEQSEHQQTIAGLTLQARTSRSPTTRTASAP